MCLALPALVVALTPPDAALIDIDGVRKTISLELVVWATAPTATTGLWLRRMPGLPLAGARVC